MITTKLAGGLGNQMFQYAIGRHLALRNKTQLLLDISQLNNKDPNITFRTYELNIFNISAKIIPKEKIILPKIIKEILFRLLKRRYIKQKGNSFNKEVLANYNKNICLEGYWQCENYFKDIEDIIKQDFKIKIEPSEQNKVMLKKIKSTNSICIHIRRGDYVADPKTKAHHGVCSLGYYYNSIKEIKKKVKSPVFYVFSDDINWARENIKIKDKTIFVNINSTDKAYEDLRLMSNCKHFIIANSSFSWWGAWLSNNPNKIVCAPYKWFNQAEEGDIVPRDWRRIGDMKK